uniref:Casein kinase 2, alpha prime interacting protein n=1 Tax=Jaculus jaculus TaxID=51337 RepID=A0A8C5KSE5_JACJA
MVPLVNDAQYLVPLDNSCQLSTNHSLTHHCTDKEPNELNHKPEAKVQPLNNEVSVPQVSSNKKTQNFSHSQDLYNRPTKSSSSQLKCTGTISPDFHCRSTLSPHGKAINSLLPHPKPKTTSSSLEPSQTSLCSRLPLPKSQMTSSSPDHFCKSPSLRSNYRASSSSLPILQHQKSPSLNTIWKAPFFTHNQRVPSSTLLQPTSQKFSSLDSLWTCLLESNQRSLSSPTLNKLQRNDFLPVSPSPKPTQMAQSSSAHDSRPQKMLSSNSSVLRLPMSILKYRKSPLLSHTMHQSQSLPLFKAKSQMPLRLDSHFRALSSPGCHSKLYPTSLPNVKNRAMGLPPFHHGPKPKNSEQSLQSTKPSMRNAAASTMDSKFQSKCSLEFNTKPELDNEIPWVLDYSHPCVVKGGTVPIDVVNKIVNSVSKTTIQKDLSRQILFRRMRGRPNPRPGPRLSSTYSVCLDCASCIKSQCCHLTGKRDPRGATLFVIPTPEASAEGKIEVKIVLILSLPETSGSPWFPLQIKENQPDEDPDDDNLEELEKITQFFPASESDIIHGLKGKKEWVPVMSGSKERSQQPQAIDWLLYVKKSNNCQPHAQLPSPSSSSSSSSSSSYSSASSSSSSSSSAFSSPPSLKVPPSPSFSGNVFRKVLSYHRLPPGVSWLEFICSQSSSPKRKRVRNRTTKSRTKGSNTLLKYFQKKFQHRKS